MLEGASTRTRTAYHEAGHAVLSGAMGGTLKHISIRGAHGTLGRTAQRMLASPTDLARAYLAGFAAEHILTGRRPHQYDAETALGILAHTDPSLTETYEGIEGTDGYGVVRQLLRTGVREDEAELRREVDRLYESVRNSLAELWPAVKTLAGALLEHEQLDGEAIIASIGRAGAAALHESRRGRRKRRRHSLRPRPRLRVSAIS
jgi:hypothetical protein